MSVFVPLLKTKFAMNILTLNAPTESRGSLILGNDGETMEICVKNATLCPFPPIQTTYSKIRQRMKFLL